jgi:hypothetical protein
VRDDDLTTCWHLERENSSYLRVVYIIERFTLHNIQQDRVHEGLAGEEVILVHPLFKHLPVLVGDGDELGTLWRYP